MYMFQLSLLQTSGFTPLWSENTFCMTSILLHLLRFVLAQVIAYLGKCSAGTLKAASCIPLLFGGLACKCQLDTTVLLSASRSLLIFCLVVLPLVEKEVLESTTINLDLSVSSCSSINFLFHVLCSFIWYEHIKIALMDLPFYH